MIKVGNITNFCREGTEGKSLSMNPGTRGVKEVYLNLMHKVRGQPDKKVSVSLSAGEMVVLRRLSEVDLLPPLFSWKRVMHGHGTGLAKSFQSFICCAVA